MMIAFNHHEAVDWDPTVGRDALAKLMARDDLGSVHLLERDERTLGYFVLTWGYDLEWNGRDAMLTELWIEPEARGGGDGTRAIAEVERVAREAGAAAVHLMVRHDNEVAQRVYARAGFKSPGRALLTKKL